MAADPNITDQINVPSDDPVVAEAKRRFDQCSEYEGTARERFINDIKFANGDPDNGYQWPNAVRRTRDIDQRPCLTLNVTRQHNLQIVNDMRKNKTAVKVRATGGGATTDSAGVFAQVIHRIEYQSKASDIYTQAIDFQVAAGIGWWRIVTDYAPGDTFDQEIYLRPINDPLAVYIDPDAQEKDKSDAKFAFVFDDVPRREFKAAYPRFADLASEAPLGIGSTYDDWITKDHVRLCEYFRRVPKNDKVISFVGPDGKRRTIRGSRMTPAMRDEVLDDPQTSWRTITDEVVEWKLICGQKVIDSTEWVGKYIPLICVIGQELIVDGVMDRKGHTRAMKDSQRMYNYNASGQVEFVALQSKTPYLAPAKAIEELEEYWKTANTQNHSVLPWNHVDDDGTPIPPPVRQQPPTASPAFEAGMTTAFNQMMMTSGQYQNQMGMMGNERTGEAISQRQQQGDTATFHYPDNFATAIRFTGIQLIDLIPKVYDTKRLMMVMADDGVDEEVEIDPTARQSYLQHRGREGEVIRKIFNPNVGKYEVEADAGPAYGTRREETVKILTLILTQAPALTGIVGDLLLSAMDFKEAQEAARRLKRMVPAKALGKGPTPQEVQLTQQVQSLQMALAKTIERAAKDSIKLVGKGEMRDIDVYKAETERFKALADSLGMDPEGIRQVLAQLVSDTGQTSLAPVIAANAVGLVDSTQANELAGQPPVATVGTAQ